MKEAERTITGKRGRNNCDNRNSRTVPEHGEIPARGELLDDIKDLSYKKGAVTYLEEN